MNANELVLMSCSLTAKQHAKLKRLSRNTHIPMNIYIRKAVDNLLSAQRRWVNTTKSQDDPQELFGSESIEQK